MKTKLKQEKSLVKKMITRFALGGVKLETLEDYEIDFYSESIGITANMLRYEIFCEKCVD